MLSGEKQSVTTIISLIIPMAQQPQIALLVRYGKQTTVEMSSNPL